MNKSWKRGICLLLSALTAFSVVGCGGGDEESSSAPNVESSSTGTTTTKKYDTETRAVTFATESLDGNFNPFFSTSAGDSEMLSMTQLGMLTTDKSGNIICGEDEPTVALSYSTNEIKDGNKVKYTDYEFVIKNGIKFSDGTPLTIKDILFNMYVYLDPMYMGSATMYSTDIVGLQSYRRQEDLGEDADVDDSATNEYYAGLAVARLEKLVDYLDEETSGFTQADIDQAKADVELTKELFLKEVNTAWTMSTGQIESLKDEYTFTEDWQVYYYNAGLVTEWYVQGDYMRDKDKKYITNITPLEGTVLEDGTLYKDRTDNCYNPDIAEEINKAATDAAGLAALKAKGYSDEEAAAELIKQFAVKTVYDNKAGNRLGLIEIASNPYAYIGVRSQLLERFAAEEKSNALKGDGSGLKITTISGITTDTKEVDGVPHDVLKIRINGVDPKAIYNFSFAVAPMHYYSGSLNGVDYAKQADGKTKFGVAFSDQAFFQKVLQAPEKNAKPMGAGPYQVSNRDYETTDVDGSEFYSNNWVYFARNDYFHTVGTGIENAKIKFLRYKVVNSDNILQTLQSKEIDVGEPNATKDNLEKIATISFLNQQTVPTNGYGYVGINPAFVPDIEVRKAIMKAMDPYYCMQYYTSANADIIYRSMSNQSWIWNYLTKPNDYYYPLAESNDEIKQLVRDAGWKLGSDGVFEKDGKKLDLVFTIAGATTDHPAFTMFSLAAEMLNACGFKVTVKTDVRALSKLATGGLAVWAAAWSSTVDPDMYQVYHKDSTATSTKNWGYDDIKKNEGGQFTYELGILNKLSTVIEEARDTNVQADRAAKYEIALNYVMDLAVELPTYQRKDCVAYNKEVINPDSLNQDPTAFAGLIDKIWELDYN